jgi:hypothetical protein
VFVGKIVAKEELFSAFSLVTVLCVVTTVVG